jgi:hypothetical protein
MRSECRRTGSIPKSSRWYRTRHMRRQTAFWLAMLTGTLMILCAALFAWLQTPERETRPSAAAGKLSSALYGRRL